MDQSFKPHRLIILLLFVFCGFIVHAQHKQAAAKEDFYKGDKNKPAFIH